AEDGIRDDLVTGVQTCALPICVVCQNTLSMALRGKEQSLVFKHAHQGNYRLMETDADDFFKFSLQRVEELGIEFQAMNSTPCPRSEERRVGKEYRSMYEMWHLE